MKLIRTNTVSPKLKSQILHLWNTEYPQKLNYMAVTDFNSYLENLAEPFHLILIDAEENVRGWYFDFIREGEKWFAIIIDPTLHGEGYGTKLLNLAKEKEPVLNGWVIDKNEGVKRNGKPYNSPMEFYLKNGFKLLPEIRLALSNLSAVKIQWNRL